MTSPGDDGAGRDGIVVALSSIALGALTGGIVMTAGTLSVRSLSDPTQSSGFAILSASVVLGFASAVASALGASRPVTDLWQRAVIAAIAFFGAAFLSVLSAPIDMFAGRPGLLGWVLLLGGAWVWTLHIRRSAA